MQRYFRRWTKNESHQIDLILGFDNFPKTTLLHAIEDTTVPASSSQLFFDEFSKVVPEGILSIELIENFNHTDFVLGFMNGTEEKQMRVVQLLRENFGSAI